jgi:PST family polysaccharide transporter
MKEDKNPVSGLKATFIWTAAQVLIKVVCGIIMNKVVAVTLGPSGLALIGQFQNFYSLCVGVASGSVHSGIVKYTSQYKDDSRQRRYVWMNSIYILLILTCLLVLLILPFSQYISDFLFSEEISSKILIIFALSLLFAVINLAIISVINGLGNHSLFSSLNIYLNIYLMILVVFGAYYFAAEGAIYAFIIAQSSILCLTFIIVVKRYGLDFFKIDLNHYNASLIKKLLQYGLVSFVSGASMSIMLLLVRNIIIQEASLEDAGYWEALWKISTYVVMFGSLPVSIYYLPKYAAITSVEIIRKNFWESVKFIIPILIFLAFFIYIFKELIIEVLFSPEFSVIASVIPLMLIGDIIKFSGYLIVNILYAKSFIKQLIIIDVVSNLLMFFLAYMSFPAYGLEGLGYSYIMVNITVFMYMLFFYRRLSDSLIKEMPFV